MSDEPQEKKEHKELKPEKAKPLVVDPLSDAYKFGIFCVRAVIAAATGKRIGDWRFDAAIGDAIAQLHPPSEVAGEGTAQAMLLHGMNGAWQAAKGDDEVWE
jgi:hypothetical protein